MSDKYNYKDSFINYKNTSNKFEFFFLGVILAALSLSIQTFDTTKEYSNIFLIIICWILFLVSFLAGFFRRERSILSDRIQTESLSFINWKNILGNLEKRESYSEQELKNVNDRLKSSKKYLKQYDEHNKHAYLIQKWSFFYALLFYILFKLSNTIQISLTWLGLITFLSIIINIISVKTYSFLLKKNIDGDED